MEITEVRIKLTSSRKDDRLKAFCSITLDREFVVRDIKTQTGAECDTIEQLLPLLGEVDGNQDRTA